MKANNSNQITLPIDENFTTSYKIIILNKTKFLEELEKLENSEKLDTIKNQIISLKAIINNYSNDFIGLININMNGDTISLRTDIIIDELDQILKSQTLERAKYYIKRLKNSIDKVKTNKINDINLSKWKEYDDVLTDSLWIFDKRDTSGSHLGWYWGNFIPQIPHQMMMRYTKRNDWVLDCFLGSGTTLIESKRLGRNSIGIELNPKVVDEAKKYIDAEPNKFNVISEILIGDSSKIDLKPILNQYNIKQVQLLIMHPPYHDIIKFSNDANDLSNSENTESFLKKFGEVVDNMTPFLEKGRYLALVIGDKYSKGEWIPLGFYCMNEILKRPYILKSIIVKNFEETRAKRNQKELWRYRALVGGFYIFKHEYIMLFKKNEVNKNAFIE